MAPAGKGTVRTRIPTRMEDMDLTNREARATRNPDGVVFYKVMERPDEAEDAGVQGRAHRGAGLVGRRLRADAAQERSDGCETAVTAIRVSSSPIT